MSKRDLSHQDGNPFASLRQIDESQNKTGERGANEGRSAAEVFSDLRTKNNQAITQSLSSRELRTGAFIWTPVGLQPDGELSRADWEETGRILQRIDASIQWLIGDWVIAAENLQYGDCEQFAEELGFNVNTIYQFAWVARKVEISLRRENLSFGHHKVVAKFDPKEQRSWLNQADEKSWSIAQLREAIKSATLLDSSTQSEFDIPAKIEQRYQKATDELRSAIERGNYLAARTEAGYRLTNAERDEMLAISRQLRNAAKNLDALTNAQASI